MPASKPLPEGRELHVEKSPKNPNEILPKISSDILYWSQEFHVTGPQLHEAIRKHGTSVSKVGEALKQKH